MTGAVGLGVLLVASVAPSPAGSTVVEREHYEGTDSFTINDLCDFPIEIDAEFHGSFLLREGTRRHDGAFFVHDKFWYSETWSANGKWFVLSGNGLFQETQATPLGDGVFEFHTIEAGQPFTVTDMDGNVLVRDRGVIRSRFIFDSENDSEPGGIVIEEFEPSFGGPHPGFFIEPETACDLLAPDPA